MWVVKSSCLALSCPPLLMVIFGTSIFSAAKTIVKKKRLLVGHNFGHVVNDCLEDLRSLVA